MGRTLTEREKAERAARRIEAKQREQLGPLFADQGEKIDRTALLYRRRMGWAREAVRGQEMRGANEVLDGLLVRQLIRTAREHIPADVVDRLVERWGEMPTYAQERSWRDLLAGKKVVLAWEEVAGPTRYQVRLMRESEVWPPEGWAPPWSEVQARGYYWSECQACGLWHAPEQIECMTPALVPDDEVMGELEGYLRRNQP